MSDPTSGASDRPEPGLPEPELPEPPADATADDTAADDTVRVPVEPEVPWEAPEAARPLPWEAPAAAAPSAWVPPSAGATPVGPTTTPGDPSATPDGDAVPAGVLSAATVGWVAPPPAPVATGKPGWVIASVGARFGAYLLDGVIVGVIVATVALTIAIAFSEQIESGLAVDVALTVALLGFYFVYFVGFWTSQGKATPGMRLFKLQVANAADGSRLAIGPATIRWLALGYFFSLFLLIPALGVLVSWATLIWAVALLVTTSNHAMHQGLHDRWAKSVVVRPEGASSSGGAWFATCLIIILLIGFMMLIPIVLLVALGDQLTEILSTVGNSI